MERLRIARPMIVSARMVMDFSFDGETACLLNVLAAVSIGFCMNVQIKDGFC